MKLKCGHEASVWKEEPPESHNAYRVECTVCGRFAKWGTKAELPSVRSSNAQVVVVPYESRDAGPTLEAFFE
jgi:hypothetical protein